MIESALRAVEPIFRRTLVVAKAETNLPSLTADVIFDQYLTHGPLAGLISGLRASGSQWCFVTGCDMPFLDRDAIRLMADRWEGAEIVAVLVSGRVQPLHAFYHVTCLDRGEALLRKGVGSLMALHDLCQVKVLSEIEFPRKSRLRQSMRDLDTPEEYKAALAG